MSDIQIFGSGKSRDTRKAGRFFKERGIKYRFIDLAEKGLSRGELLMKMPLVRCGKAAFCG